MSTVTRIVEGTVFGYPEEMGDAIVTFRNEDPIAIVLETVSELRTYTDTHIIRSLHDADGVVTTLVDPL